MSHYFPNKGDDKIITGWLIRQIKTDVKQHKRVKVILQDITGSKLYIKGMSNWTIHSFTPSNCILTYFMHNPLGSRYSYGIRITLYPVDPNNLDKDPLENYIKLKMQHGEIINKE